jgi:tripartite-type tricarboxylate transporter receptor subunit TctC
VTVHVPYSGGAPAVTALLAGDVQILSLNPTALIPHVQAGKIRIVAQTGAKRSPLIPDVPTVAESGFPGFEAPVWMAIVVPARTPVEAVKRLHAELARIIRAPELKARLWDKQWIDPVGSMPDEAARVVRAETDKWARVGRALGISLD